MLLGFQLVMLSAVPPVALVMDISVSGKKRSLHLTPHPRLNRNNLDLVNKN